MMSQRDGPSAPVPATNEQRQQSHTIFGQICVTYVWVSVLSTRSLSFMYNFTDMSWRVPVYSPGSQHSKLTELLVL